MDEDSTPICCGPNCVLFWVAVVRASTKSPHQFLAHPNPRWRCGFCRCEVWRYAFRHDSLTSPAQGVTESYCFAPCHCAAEIKKNDPTVAEGISGVRDGMSVFVRNCSTKENCLPNSVDKSSGLRQYRGLESIGCIEGLSRLFMHCWSCSQIPNHD